MLQDRRRPGLLGWLAGLGWFTQNGEVAATQALAMLLQERQLRAALLRHLGEIAQRALGGVETFSAEFVHDDRRRPDLEGQDADGRPLLVVEAKFGARLEAAQVRDYLNDQGARLGSDSGGAFVLLVPPNRSQEAEDVLRSVGDHPAREQTAIATPVSTAVVTWDEWLDVWDEAAGDFPAREQASVLCDLGQLREMCLTMGGLVIPPLDEAVRGRWRERESDLRRIVDQVTLQLSDPSKKLPIGDEAGYDYYSRRYIPGGYPDPKCYCSVGIAARLANEGWTPFWLRYVKQTGGFRAVWERIMASRFAADARHDDGHLWLPLQVSDDVTGTEVVAQLVGQVREILAVAAGPESR